MKTVVVIPARMASSRFPGKPLANILHLPMIEHVRRRATLAKVDEVYVATCDQEIYTTVTGYGGKAIMTASTHLDCTDRVEEAARNLVADIVIIAQGDEPLFLPEALDMLTAPFLGDDSVQCVNVLSIISQERDWMNVDVVKAVLDHRQNVMYYSRSPIPYRRSPSHCPPLYRQTGISAFRKELLSLFSALPPTAKEMTECVGFLRLLEYGHPIRAVMYPHTTVGVDHAEDIPIVEHILQHDPVQAQMYRRICSL